MCISRVEGKGKAVITDVIYSSKSTEEVQNPGSKEEYEALKVRVKKQQLGIYKDVIYYAIKSV